MTGTLSLRDTEKVLKSNRFLSLHQTDLLVQPIHLARHQGPVMYALVVKSPIPSQAPVGCLGCGDNLQLQNNQISAKCACIQGYWSPNISHQASFPSEGSGMSLTGYLQIVSLGAEQIKHIQTHRRYFTSGQRMGDHFLLVFTRWNKETARRRNERRKSRG